MTSPEEQAYAVFKKSYRITGSSPNYHATETIKRIEVPIYASSRLGVDNREVTVYEAEFDFTGYTNHRFTGITNYTENTTSCDEELDRGEKYYELSNHLGNVLAVVSDRKVAVNTGSGGASYTGDNSNYDLVNGVYQQNIGNGLYTFNSPSDDVVDFYHADVVAANDYYPFGMIMPERSYQQANTDYRFGFNGMEQDDEVKGAGNSYDFGARIYDPRVGRWLSLDPKFSKYPYLSPYNFVNSNPIIYVDDNGEDFEIVIDNDNKTIIIRAEIQTISKRSYYQALKTARHWNTQTGMYKGYTVSFQLNVTPPVEPTEKEVVDYYSKLNFYKENGKLNNKLYTKKRLEYREAIAFKRAYKSPTTNVYAGNEGRYSEDVDKQSVMLTGHYTGGVTVAGFYISMYTHYLYGDEGKNFDYVTHEFAHLFGLDDVGGKYYAPGGILEYKNFLNPISQDDIQLILEYAKDYFANPPDFLNKRRDSQVTGLICGSNTDNPLGFRQIEDDAGKPNGIQIELDDNSSGINIW